MILEVLTTVHIKVTVFWDVTPCCLVSGYLYCRSTGYLILQA